MLKKSFALILFINLFFVYKVQAQADVSLGVAKYYKIEDEKIENGDIISAVNTEYTKAHIDYDPNVMGIVALNPAVSIKPADTDQKYPVINTGETLVRVSTVNGEIIAGDKIAASTIQGVGMKATNNGYAIGIAKQDYKSNNPETIGIIKVELHPGFSLGGKDIEAQTKFAEIFSIAAMSSYEQPSKIVRHLVAALVLLLSIIFGFLTFGRIAAEGVAAVGRNPSAKTSIGVGITINVTITVAIILAGAFVAYLILSL
jgi:hypothetical protein